MIDDFQNMFVCQSRFSMLDLKKDKSTECLFVWKSNRLFRFRIYPLVNAFLPIMERFEYKIGIQFNNSALVIEKNQLWNQNWFCLHFLKFTLFARKFI